MTSRSARPSLPRAFAWILLALLCALAPATALASDLPTPPMRWDAKRVFIDPGHGGRYSNANANGLKEKNVNLWLGLELQRQLQAQGYSVGIARTTDRALCLHDILTWHYSSGKWRYRRDYSVPRSPPTDDLQARVNAANSYGADVFVSIHNNGMSTSGPKGTETWAAPNDAMGKQLAHYVQHAMIEQTGMYDRGHGTMNLYVLRWANMPAILIEGGFLTNPADARRLKSPTFRAKLCKGIAIGLRRWLDTNPFKGFYARVRGDVPSRVAAELAKRGWSGETSTVILASAGDPSSSLAAGPLARKLSAPLLLTGAASLDSSTSEQLTRLSPDAIVVLGGEGVIGSAVVTAAASAAGIPVTAVRRIAGADRYGTATLIAEEVGLGSGRVVITSGTDYTEGISGALYASKNGFPVLLAAPGSSLPAATRAFIDAHRSQISNVAVVARTSSVSNSAVTGLPGLYRIYGPDAYGVNTAVLQKYASSTLWTTYVASDRYPTAALASQVLATKQGKPLLLTAGRSISPVTRQWMTNYHDKVGAWTLVGGYGMQPTIMDAIIKKCDQ